MAERAKYNRIALIGETAADVRDVMIEGRSGILTISRPDFRPIYTPSKRRLTWPNGVIATTYSADDPEQLRGPEHDFAWGDEIGKWRYQAAWENMSLGLRLGKSPRAIATTTPRITPLMRDIIRDPSTLITRGTTYDNAENLSPEFLTRIIKKYEGTRLGRQELLAEMLEDIEGALWTHALIDRHRVRSIPENLARVVVAIDPAATSGEESDETGIIVAGSIPGERSHGYVIADRSMRGSPIEWATAAIEAYREFNADRIVAETNNGGEMIETVLRSIDPNIPYTSVRASRGKRTRAEPISALYEQGLIHHVGVFAALEDQMTTWTPDQNQSPDRMDALVWAMTELLLGEDWTFV